MIAAFVVNRSLLHDLGRFRRWCERAAAAGGYEPAFLATSEAERGVGLAQDALAGGAGLVFAAGGDGTVRACAHVLAGTGVPMAIVPLGTANLTARALGIPGEPRAALATGFGGAGRRIDLATADGMTFTAMAGMGLDAAVVGATRPHLKAGLGWAAYAGTGALRLPGRAREFQLRLDGGAPLVVQARSVVVGNAGLLPGGFRLLPAARLDDGLLDVGVLAPAGPVGWARVAWRVIAGSTLDDRHLFRLRARVAEIAADTELPRQVDGEVIGPGRALSVSVCAGALTVRVPLPAVLAGG